MERGEATLICMACQYESVPRSGDLHSEEENCYNHEGELFMPDQLFVCPLCGGEEFNWLSFERTEA